MVSAAMCLGMKVYIPETDTAYRDTEMNTTARAASSESVADSVRRRSASCASSSSALYCGKTDDDRPAAWVSNQTISVGAGVATWMGEPHSLPRAWMLRWVCRCHRELPASLMMTRGMRSVTQKCTISKRSLHLLATSTR